MPAWCGGAQVIAVGGGFQHPGPGQGFQNQAQFFQQSFSNNAYLPGFIVYCAILLFLFAILLKFSNPAASWGDQNRNTMEPNRDLSGMCKREHLSQLPPGVVDVLMTMTSNFSINLLSSFDAFYEYS